MSITAAKVMELREATGVGMMDCKKALEETGGDMEQAKDFLRKKGLSVAAKKSSRETNEGGVAIRISDDKKSASMVHLACETDFVARNDNFGELLDKLTTQALAGGGEDLVNQSMADGSGTVQDMITQSISTMGENLQLIDSVKVAVEKNGMVGGYVHSNKRIGVLVRLESDAAGDALEELIKDLAMHIAASQVHALSEADIDPAVIAKEKEIYTAQARESGKPDDIVAKMVDGRMKKFIKEVTLLDQPFVKDPDKTIKALVAERGKSIGSEITIGQFVKYQF